MYKVYVFGKEAAAEAFQMTAAHFGFEGKRIGSALILAEEGYQKVLDATYASPAAVVAVPEEA